ncbi:flavin-containing monooxygenase [Amycolatopsis rubida]|uniref:Predicted flavoprotein CzcO associated with the cation diffusion facilitator CzcD n=1 Tax=Amycolatopsis rubida TaxID=112413 RepID=A0A1I5SL84_9PSEU|nr:NAD(P)/FAD-dependent oxidoreductase [Amycolatopsis rubida]SFP71472.1 Predicted flavoprotein CzcO associated with the cation diffusion facilitator CzcD [Amycolatopsis rubida]
MIEYHETVVVGGGFGGICAAHDLLAEGRDDFVILERAAELGGVWRDNRYPNAACDVPAHFYSLSFAPNPTWTRSYAPWDEILAYINTVADDLGVRDRVRFATTLVSASWAEPAGVWNLRTAEGGSLSCRFLIVASGSLSTPRIPDLPGRETFRGEVVHTAQWDERISLAGRRVVVVGASASAAQVLPYAVDVAESVLAVIRTPPYVMPKDDQFYDIEAQARFRDEPARMDALRSAAEHRFNVEAETQAVMDEAGLAKIEGQWRDYMESEIRDAGLRELLTPSYRFGCRRPVMSSAFYPALADRRTTVWSAEISAMTETGVVTSDGRAWDADVVVLATGFTATAMFAGIEFRGESARSLKADVWREAPHAYKGTVVAGFPNLFLVTGPHTQASGSIVAVIEAQMKMIMQYLRLVDENDAVSVQPSQRAQRDFNTWVDGAMADSVWEAGACHSWYRLGMTGKVVTKWPGNLASFQKMTSTLDLGDLVLKSGPAGSPALPVTSAADAPATGKRASSCAGSASAG